MILDGRTIAQNIYNSLGEDIAQLKDTPTLGAILVWNNDESLRYIKQKRKFAEKTWINFKLFQFEDTISEEALKSEILKLNNNTEISGYIVQLPLPKHINELRVIRNIDPKKDVDGFHPENQWKVMIWDLTGFAPCTPAGVMKILEHYNITLVWKKISILGRSNIVGKPLTMMCINAGATVTSCNSRTPDISEFTKNSDIVICATGIPHILKAHMTSPDSIVIDVGFSIVNGEIHWDADYNALISQWNSVTPVPGWVGPMTVAMLLSNTYKAHILAHE